MELGLSRTLQITLAISSFGALAFVLGVVAENTKPTMGNAIQTKDVVICKYPSDPTIALGALSSISLPVVAAFGCLAVFFPYNGKTVPYPALFRSTKLSVFFTIAVGVTVFAQGMMMWATITEGLHRSRNVHHNLNNKCPTAKTGLFGGAAFLALDATLFWLVCQMLALNARADYLEDNPKEGGYEQVLSTVYNGTGVDKVYQTI